MLPGYGVPAKNATYKEQDMQVVVSDEVKNTMNPTQKDFDKAWGELGIQIKNLLQTFDPNVTWLNLYLSHDGKPSFNRTIQRSDT